MTEDQLQTECWIWAWNTYPELRRLIWAVPNGGKRDYIEAVKFQATGVLAGVHDLHMLWKGKFYTFELKVGNNQLTHDTIVTRNGRQRKVYGQWDWGKIVTNAGGMCFEVRTFERFKELIVAIMNGDEETLLLRTFVLPC